MADRPANNTGARVSAPGKGAKRTDLAPSKRPIRIATGQPFGSAKQQEKMQQARPNREDPVIPSVPASEAPVSPPAGSSGIDPRSLLAMVSRSPTAFPNDPIGAPRTSPAQISAEEAAVALEGVIANASSVSQATLRLLNDLKREALASPSFSFGQEDVSALEDLG